MGEATRRCLHYNFLTFPKYTCITDLKKKRLVYRRGAVLQV